MKSIYGSKPVTLNRAINYLHIQLAAFQLDPADSDFRRGYEQALHDMRVDLLGWPYAQKQGTLKALVRP